MAIKLGTVAAIGFDDFPPGEWLGLFRELGCETVQAYRNQDADITVEQMRPAIEAGQMPCDSLHGVYGEKYDPSSPDESARRFAVDAFKSEGDLALQLGGPLVVVHCSTIRHDPISPNERATRVNQLRKSISELGSFGREVGVQYAFENLPAYHAIGWDIVQLTGLLKETEAPNTGMCLDTGHAHMVGDAVEAVHQAGDKMIYVHLSDNFGNSDDHDMPTVGTLPSDLVAEALHEVGYEGTVMLEVFYGVGRLRKLIDEGCADRLDRLIQIANGRAKN